MTATEALSSSCFLTWDTLAILFLSDTDIVKTAPDSSSCGKLLYLPVSAHADPVSPSDLLTSAHCQS